MKMSGVEVEKGNLQVQSRYIIIDSVSKSSKE